MRYKDFTCTPSSKQQVRVTELQHLFLRYCIVGSQIRKFPCVHQVLSVRNLFLADAVLCTCSQMSFTFWEVSSEVRNHNSLFCHLDCSYNSVCHLPVKVTYQHLFIRCYHYWTALVWSMTNGLVKDTV